MSRRKVLVGNEISDLELASLHVPQALREFPEYRFKRGPWFRCPKCSRVVSASDVPLTFSGHQAATCGYCIDQVRKAIERRKTRGLCACGKPIGEKKSSGESYKSCVACRSKTSNVKNQLAALRARIVELESENSKLRDSMLVHKRESLHH